MKKILALLIITLNSAYGEYRVYQYFVKNKSILDAQAYLQLSSLDPVSFQAYHGGKSSINIDLLRSWMCPGHTGYMINYCDSPLKLKDSPLESLNE